MTLILQPSPSRVSGRTLWRIQAVARRLASAVLTVMVATFAVYAALAAAPGDPALALAGRNPSPERLALLHHELGLDRPLVVRYFDWLSGLPQGDLGQSIVYRNSSVADLLGPRFGTTVFLVVYAALLILVMGLLLGVLGGAFRRLNGPVAALTSVAIAVPGFVAAPILVSVFALGLGWFPAVGEGSGFTDQVWHLTLPAFALAIGWCAWLAQMTRTSVRAEKAREHVETANGRGLPPRPSSAGTCCATPPSRSPPCSASPSRACWPAPPSWNRLSASTGWAPSCCAASTARTTTWFWPSPR